VKPTWHWVLGRWKTIGHLVDEGGRVQGGSDRGILIAPSTSGSGAAGRRLRSFQLLRQSFWNHSPRGGLSLRSHADFTSADLSPTMIGHRAGLGLAPLCLRHPEIFCVNVLVSILTARGRGGGQVSCVRFPKKWVTSL